MKRIFCLLLALLCVFGTASASDSSDLARAQKAAAGFLDALDGEPIPTYKELKRSFAPQFEFMWGEYEYENFRKQALAKYGRMMDYRFYAFERMDESDRLMYIGSFTRARDVLVLIALDKGGAITAYRLTPYRPKRKTR